MNSSSVSLRKLAKESHIPASTLSDRLAKENLQIEELERICNSQKWDIHEFFEQKAGPSMVMEPSAKYMVTFRGRLKKKIQEIEKLTEQIKTELDSIQ
jgi:hypothetical protein